MAPDPALDGLREDALAANLALPRHGLVTLTWGNVSAIDRERGLVAIKPSGVAYDAMTADDIVVLELDGTQVAGSRAHPPTRRPTWPSTVRFTAIGGIVHTHSTWATAWAQAGREIPLLGTTHADLSPHPVPVTRALTPDEVSTGYEDATATVLIEAVGAHGAARGPAPCWSAGTRRSAGVRARRRRCSTPSRSRPWPGWRC